MKFDFMKQHANEFPVKKMAKVLNVSRTGYYAYLNKKTKSLRKKSNEELMTQINLIYKQNRGVYGSPRIHMVLKKRGKKCSRQLVARLMKANNIQAKTVKRWKKHITTGFAANGIADNLLKQEFNAGSPNQIWCADITCIKTKQGFLYIAAVMDLFSRRIVGMSHSHTPDINLSIKAFNQAIHHRRPRPGLILHSDRGIQYTNKEYKKITEQKGVMLSMSAKGNCYDNAVMESFFHTLKTELVAFYRYQSKQDAWHSVFEYVEFFYNRIRTHSTLDYFSPAEFEKQARSSRVKPALPAVEATPILCV